MEISRHRSRGGETILIMPKFKWLKDTLDWIIRLQGAYAILATLLAGGVGTGIRAVLRYYTHLPALWITPIWLLSVALILSLLLLVASRRWMDLARPNFIFDLDNIIWVYDSAKDMTVFFIAARIVSIGLPSITQNWSAIYSAGESSEPMKGFYLVGPYVLTLGNEQITIDNDDLLNVKTAETVIEKGRAVYGRLLFTIPGNRDAQIRSLHHRIEVRFCDYLANSYSASYIPSSRPLPSLTRHAHEKTQFIEPQQANSQSSPQLSE